MLASRVLASPVLAGPVLRPGRLALEDADPGDYTHLVFACGPLSGLGIADLHRRFVGCRRIAIGVSVPDPAAPAAVGFHAVLPRDGPGIEAAGDLSIAALCPDPPRDGARAGLGVLFAGDVADGWPDGDVAVAGVVMVARQAEYGDRGRPERVAKGLDDWLLGCGCARIPVDTRLDPRDWRLCREPGGPPPRRCPACWRR